MVLCISDKTPGIYTWIDDLQDDDVIIVTLEKQCVEDGAEPQTATIVFRSATGRRKWTAGETNHWFVLDTEHSTRHVVDELYNRAGSRVFWDQPMWKRYRRLRAKHSLYSWARQHVEFGIRPFFASAQLHPNMQFVLGQKLRVAAVTDQRKIYRDDFRESFAVGHPWAWIVTNASAGKVSQLPTPSN